MSEYSRTAQLPEHETVALDVQNESCYELYRPVVRHGLIYRAQANSDRYGYNHDVSLAWFDGCFYAAWNSHHSIIEGEPGQVNVIATSRDFVQWSDPVKFLDLSETLEIDPAGVMWQPNLINYDDKELWCIWTICHPVSKSHELVGSGTYLSKLSRHEGRWTHTRIFDRVPIEGAETIGFASQNPFMCKSGRVIAPLTFIDSSSQVDKDDSFNVRWNVCAYTDDGGKTWELSNPISMVGDAFGQWEPFFYEQADGILRCMMRNMTMGSPTATHWQLTCRGRGSQKGEPMVFQSDPQFSRIETANTRCQVMRLSESRYCMLHHDQFLRQGLGQWEWNPHRNYNSRFNISLFFSRTGRDDFIAGIPVSRPGMVSAYPQGIEHEGKIYLAYTIGCGEEARSIEGAIVDPVPGEDKKYIWPRYKDYVEMEAFQTESGGRAARRVNMPKPNHTVKPGQVDGVHVLEFSGHVSAGVETDEVAFDRGMALRLDFRFKIQKMPKVGFLVLCSLGDRIPIRLAIPSNRQKQLYAYCHQEWRPVADIEPMQWNDLCLICGPKQSMVIVNASVGQTFENPLTAPNMRVYLGDGFESDYLPNNRETEFVIEMASIRTHSVAVKDYL